MPRPGARRAECVSRSGSGDIGDAATVVLVNPNNPDGRVLTDCLNLRLLAARCAARGGLLSSTRPLPISRRRSASFRLPPATMVLRSFGKTYGLAGLRLGFAIGEPDD
jgi:cobalamin biosynthetic protein CobC